MQHDTKQQTSPGASFASALAAFLALPAMVAGLMPWLIARGDPWAGAGPEAVRWLGLLLAGVGLAVLLRCVRDFFVAGRGTLAPWDPPRQLVAVGLYRWVRNPMYVGVLTLVLGFAAAGRSPWLAAYAAVLAIAFHLRVRFFEEPWLARTFPEAWPAYAAAVPRWWPARRLKEPE